MSSVAARLAIDLDAIACNYRLLAARAAPAAVAAVVKADAYGLGAALVAPVLWRAGARLFFVAHAEEALVLRPQLPAGAGIAVLNGLPPGAGDAFAAVGVIPVLNQLSEIAAWRAAGARRGRPLPAFLHVDTGMNRLGLEAGEVERVLARPDLLDGIAWRGLISHLVDADVAAAPLAWRQLAAFRQLSRRLPAMPASLANSSGLFRLGARGHFRLVRPGAALYGINPLPEQPNPMNRVVTLSARILQLREVRPGMTVGYGGTHQVTAPARIATLALGYADGWMRALSGQSSVMIAGQAAPIIGRVSMDLVTVDASAAPAAAVGGWAEVIGAHQDPDAVARLAGTIGYEILTALGARFQRVATGGADP